MRDVAGLSKILAEGPPVQRLRTVALDLPRSSGAARVDDAWSARMGRRVYTEKSRFVDDFRLVAEKNDCCVFVTHDENEVAFVTEQNLKPPPRAIVHEIRDTPSMNEFLRGIASRTGTKGERPVVFFVWWDTPRIAYIRISGINAAVRRLQTKRWPTWPKPWEAGDGRQRGKSRRGQLLLRDLEWAGIRAQIRSQRDRIQDQSAVQPYRFAGTGRSILWTRAEVSVLNRSSAERFVTGLGWESGRDGVPAAVSLKFKPIASSGGSARPIYRRWMFSVTAWGSLRQKPITKRRSSKAICRS